MIRILLISAILSSFAFSKNLLWEVENGDAKIYITGSIHYGLDDFYPLPNALDSTFAVSDNLVLEIHLDSMQSKAMMMMSKMMLSGDKTLKSELSPEVYQKLEKQLESILKTQYQMMESSDVITSLSLMNVAIEGLDLSAGLNISAVIDAKLEDAFVNTMMKQFYNMKPWAAAMTLTQMKVAAEGMDPEKGIDKYFFKKAKASNKAVLQLESVESQIEVFDSFDELSDKFVLKTIDSMNDDMAMLDEMIKAWKEADLKKLDEIINTDADDPEFKEINKKMLDERNFKMMDKIEDYLETDKTYFIVVGAGHLSGENGLINLLKQKYNVVQL